MGQWYSRPVLFVADVQRAVDFYVGKLGFSERWRFADEVAQVDRDDCEIMVKDRKPSRLPVRGIRAVHAGFDDVRQRTCFAHQDTMSVLS